MTKLFKNCNVLYFKKSEELTDLITKNQNIFKGKIIISDFPELNRICSIKGIIHVVNLSPHYIPNEKIDCIVTNTSESSELEAKIIRSGLGFSILYLDTYQKWCGICNTMTKIDNDHSISRYCSEKCMKKDSGFSVDSKPDTVKDLGINNIVSRMLRPPGWSITHPTNEIKEQNIIEFDKSLSDKRTASNIKKNAEKFQTSMVKDAIRLEYAFKRESYKKEMRQPSLRKASISDKKTPEITVEESSSATLCKSVTKKGKKCTNKALVGSQYCGILAHNLGSHSVESKVVSMDDDED